MFTIYLGGITQSQLRHRDRLMEDIETKRVFSMHFDPDKSRVAKETVHGMVEQVLYHMEDFPWHGPVLHHQLTVFPPTGDHYENRQHTQKPDVDNLLKLIFDACTGALWHDDGQVVGVIHGKMFGEVPVAGGTILEICFYPEHPRAKAYRLKREAKKEQLHDGKPPEAEKRKRFRVYDPKKRDQGEEGPKKDK